MPVQVCNHVQGLELMLANAPPDFALQLAAAAASKDLLNMDTWLEQTTQQHKLPYAQVRAAGLMRLAPNTFCCLPTSLSLLLPRLVSSVVS